MHIPDGFLSNQVWISTTVISGGFFIYATKKLQKSLDDKMIPAMSVLTAFIFAAQMVNFPIPGGTSGHLIGAGLVSYLFGPLPAFFVISIVLLIQCFFFADGGITALGANTLNMAILAPFGAYIIYKVLTPILKNKLITIGIASCLSVVISAVACAIELALSGTAPFLTVISIMAVLHLLIGIGEGFITVFILTLIERWLPEIKKTEENVKICNIPYK